MLVLILKSHLFAGIFITLLITPQFAAKMNINPVKKIRRLAAVSTVQYTRRRAKSFGTTDA